MDTLRTCVFVFCIACVVMGIMERLSMPRRRFSVIKLVGTLYILATVFVPLQSMKPAQWTPDIPDSPKTVQTPDTAQLVLTAAQEALAKRAEQALAAAGISFTGVDVSLAEQEDGVQFSRITVTVPDGADAAGAADVITQAMGVQAPVEVRKEGL